MNPDLHHLLLISPENIKYKTVLKALDMRPCQNFIRADSEMQIRNALSAMPLDANVILWVHLNKYDQDSSDYPVNLGIANRLYQNSTINSLGKINFFTTGGVDDVKGDYVEDSRIHKICKGKDVFAIDIFDPENAAELPECQSPRLLLSPNFDSVDSFAYPTKDWDWRIGQLRMQVPDDIMKAILGAVVVKINGKKYTEYQVEMVKGGLSGAIVLKVEVKDGNNDRCFLLKMDEDGEDINAEYGNALKTYYNDLDTNVFIGAYPMSYVKIYGWHCLRYKFLSGKGTLRGFLKKNLLTKKLDDVLIDVFNRFNEFEQAGQSLFKKSMLPLNAGEFIRANGETLKYQGLLLKMSARWKVLEIVDVLEERYLQNSSSTDYNIQARLNDLRQFLQNDAPKYKGKSLLELSHQKGTPLGIPHGDFHTANILIDETTQQIFFIDFANVPDQPIKHKFLDIGKFSADMEISVFPDQALLTNPKLLLHWMDAHKTWLNGKVVQSEYKEIEAIYHLNTTLRDRILSTKTPSEMDRNEAVRQFHMVRLHYFLKAISYNHEIREKILFFIRASLDILEFLIAKK